MDVHCQSMTCCPFYTHCTEGLTNTLDYNMKIFHWSETDSCPTLGDAIQYMKPGEPSCETSEYGCCQIQTTCDDYVRLNYPYSKYQTTNDNINPEVGMTSTHIPKHDLNGSNCPTADETIDTFIKSLYKTDMHGAFWCSVFILCMCSCPCLYFCKDISEMIKDKYQMTNFIQFTPERCYAPAVSLPPIDNETRETRETRETSETSDEDDNHSCLSLCSHPDSEDDEVKSITQKRKGSVDMDEYDIP